MIEYVVDIERLATFGLKLPQSGIHVRAKKVEDGHERWGSWDISALTITSLKDWLRSRGGFNPWAEQAVASLLHYSAVEIVNTWPETELQ